MAESADLNSAIAELDDGYLKAMLLLSVRRAQSDEPRRGGFWHALAVALADEQEKRRRAAEVDPAAAAAAPDDLPPLQDLLEELRLEMAGLQSELRESVGDMDVAGDQPG
jgi:hypothetical protein